MYTQEGTGIFYRLSSRLLVTTLLTITLLAVLVVIITVQFLSLNNSIKQLNDLGIAALKTRELSLYVQYASADSNAYVIGHIGQAEEYAQRMAAFSDSMTELRHTLDSAHVLSEMTNQLDALDQTQKNYIRAIGRLFAASAARRASPSPETKIAEEQAWEITDHLTSQLDQQSQTLSQTINTRLNAAQEDVGIRILQLSGFVIVVGLFILALATLIQAIAARAIGHPISVLVQAARRLGSGHLDERVTVDRQDEIGLLADAFNKMADDLQFDRQSLHQQDLALQQKIEETRRLLSTVESLDTPLLPILNGIVVLPLIGYLDERRSHAVLRSLLDGVSNYRAQVAILDLTGMALLDANTLQQLQDAIHGAQLLGAHVILVGVKANFAKTIAQQKFRLGAVAFRRDLQSGIAHAQMLLNRTEVHS